MIYLMAALAQQSYLASFPPISVMKWTLPTSTMNYVPLFDTYLKKNVLIIGGDTNTQIDKEENNKFCLHNLPNKGVECY